MRPIQALSEGVINKIAAGEVIERPVSVVKELIENSLDALATNIEIEIQSGGKKSILVRDNGCGIPAHEMPLALKRHTTSKIRSDIDLENIATFGFRGEALASIGSISHLTFISKTQDNPGYKIISEGEKIVEEGLCSHPQGTSVQVKYLFHQTPARLKFLKSDETELAHILDYVSKIALIHPHVFFQLSHQGRKLLSLQEGNSFKKRFLDFLPQADELVYEVSNSFQGIEITALLAHPNLSRPTHKVMNFFVNGRPVSDRIIHHAVMEAYRNFLMKGKYPYCAVFLTLPGAMVDVNVHPTKAEVRFSNSQLIHRAVYETLINKLREEPWKQSVHEVNFQSPEILQQETMSLFQPQNKIDENKSKTINVGSHFYQDLRVVGQVLGTYIVCESGNRLILIDQHAAHERLLFEQLKAKDIKKDVQYFLVPNPVELKSAETLALKDKLVDLATLGFEIEHFGGNTFMVKSVPVLLNGRINLNQLLFDLARDILEMGQLTSFTDHLHSILARISCHAAVRAHDKLDEKEMNHLLQNLDGKPGTTFCPHGRPVSVEIKEEELKRWFKRVV
ncbi:MAG: hypothetical protein A3G32_08005 [Deltaproteobacteria bacterium RIFCSPLOWO2_12_FULL_40_28]|nr:MAG: hypothetical protein A3C45_00705 [Deltaproteobacteria bacterium RIFCSPHIGHO2_02_FULL_40_28]OGQ20855.1 MAG: hypothetical protein A3E27_03370 [Deltaproteobacteria bacterium RIFCSPHIGHO2_12_FULL_40_32]OGQ39256.1 MAG: hypothetical protein A3I69_04730 [Deltaproteobacteria bacterium RIFCSPLOWO2_02_FULL_40_36]OGQ54537.1 MAG: hypothetical protein A3G32_08005 [Deltaproteobacteria bacterium RIFCSPLOWO2_12_FULL_40_28]